MVLEVLQAELILIVLYVKASVPIDYLLQTVEVDLVSVAQVILKDLVAKDRSGLVEDLLDHIFPLV